MISTEGTGVLVMGVWVTLAVQVRSTVGAVVARTRKVTVDTPDLNIVPVTLCKTAADVGKEVLRFKCDASPSIVAEVT